MKQINTKYCYEFMKGFLYGLFFTIFFVSFKKRNINDIIDDEEDVDDMDMYFLGGGILGQIIQLIIIRLILKI